MYRPGHDTVSLETAQRRAEHALGDPAGNGALSDAALDERTTAVLATPKNANHHQARREPVAIDAAR
jgi:hypothetical protein